jgi:general L-amino acid transport system permease protein
MTSATTAPARALPPPPEARHGPAGWARRNLFSSRTNGLVTIVLALVLAWVTGSVATWVLTEARWGVVTDNLRLFLIGLYPPPEAWRPWLCLAGLSTLAGLSWGTWGGPLRTAAVWLAAGQAALALLVMVSPMGPAAVVGLLVSAALVPTGAAIAARAHIPRRVLSWAWVVSLPVTWIVLSGGAGWALLPPVESNLWGGLLLTLILATVSILLSFPVGVLLALGRRSSLPALRILSTAFIELVRGVPLVTIIFLADIMLPLFLPGEVRIDRATRAIGGLTLFCAAYVAENVRGGLQAIPRGQIEAAQALGLGTIATNRFIVLPQALRAVIPANVGLFISVLKDTTLVIIVGLLELLGIGRAVLAQPEWLGTQYEVYGFIAVVFFILCWTISRASYRLEAALGVGIR